MALRSRDTMYVSESGAEDGVPIVFLHGSMVSGWMWADQIEDLSEFRCLVPDFPGFDRSASEAWVSFGGTADTVAEMIRNRCGDDGAHLVGLSLGGIVGLNVAVRHPETVRSLIVSGVPYGAVPPLLGAISRALVWLYQREWGARLVARFLGIPDDESVEAFLATAGRTDPRALRAVIREVSGAPLPERLGAIEAPVLAVVGERDTAPARRAVVVLAETIPECEGYVVPGVGHQWNAEDRELFSDMVRCWVTSGFAVEGLRPAAGTH